MLRHEKGIFVEMGSCASAGKTPDSGNKMGIPIGSKNQKMVTPSPGDSTISLVDVQRKEQGPPVSFDPWSLRTLSREFGSKEELFYDSRAWLDSDCEDDFFSVTGDFTPSRSQSFSGTPNYQRSLPGSPHLNKILFTGVSNPKPEPSPTAKKKTLAELFRESLGGEQDPDTLINITSHTNINEKLEDGKDHQQIPPKSSKGTPHISGSIERTPNRDPKNEKERKTKATQCCLPGLATNRSFNDKKQQTSPGLPSGG